MRKISFVLGMLAATGSFAQQVSQTQAYNVSVFDTYSKLPMNTAAMAATQAKLVELLPGFHATTDKLTGMIRDVYGKAMQVPGAKIEEKANYIINNKLGDFGVNATEWQKTNTVDAQHASYAHYEQYISGHKVAFSQLTLRFTPDGKLQRIVMKNYGRPDQGIVPVISNADVYNTNAMKESLAGISVTEKTVDADWVWFPIPGNKGYVLHPAWAFVVNGTDNKTNMPTELTGFVDAVNGELLYRMNEVKEEVNLVVKGSVYKNGVTVSATDEPLANLQVTIGSNTANTNDTGFYKNTAINPTQSATIKLQGTWSVVRTGSGTGTIPSFNYAITANGGTYVFPNTTPSSDQHVNGYYHVNRVHDHIKSIYPSFTGVDIALPTILDRSSTTGCNAYYSGSTINFYVENSSCISFAKIGDIVYHEYGHFVNHKFYANVKGGSTGMVNGGLNEGYADVWAMSLTHDPVLGKGAFKNGANIRTYNGNPKVYPMNRTSEVHANGEIIAGSWWDVGVNIGSPDSMTSLFTKSMYDVADGPEGTEGEVYHEALISAIENDDDDANLNNGTPHFSAIVAAFARHGIYLFSDAMLVHTEVDHKSQENTDVTVDADITVNDPAYFDKMKLVYRVRSSATWDTVSMTNGGPGAAGGTKFSAIIPGKASGSIVEYYFVTYDINGNGAYSFPTNYNPSLGSSDITVPYQFAVGVYRREVAAFENNPLEWTLTPSALDKATSGQWVWGTPIPSYWKPSGTSLSFMEQTDKDHTTGSGKCIVTGNALTAASPDGDADVDGGSTTLMSPIYDISGYRTPIIEYYRWYSSEWGPRDSNPRTDPWVVQIRDASSKFWQNVESTYQSDVSWRRNLINVRDYLPSSTQIQVRFIATDDVQTSLTGNGQNTVEAAVDDFGVYDAWATGVNSVKATSGISVYPNPANDMLYINMPAGANGTITCSDLTGRQLMVQQTVANTSLYSFATTALASGTYVITVQSDKYAEVKKVTIAH